MTQNKRTLVLVHNREYSAFRGDEIYLDQSWKLDYGGSDSNQKHSFIMNMIDSSDLEKIHQKSRELEKKLLTDLALTLNCHHETTLSERAWKIILGHWLRMYSQTVCKYIYAIQRAYDNEVSEVLLNEAKYDFEPPLDTSEASSYFENKKIIELICKEACLAMQKNISYNLSDRSESNTITSNFPLLKYKASFSEKLNAKLKLSMYSVGKYLVKKTDALIVSTYLPISIETLLNFRFGQWPRFFTYQPTTQEATKSVEWELRMNLFGDYNSASVEEKVGWSLIPKILPLVFLENFQFITNQIQRSKFPIHPKLIFTANSFMDDEIFKQFAAFQVDKGVPYFVAQHGNNYGTILYANPTIEQETCDHFISWGWKHENTIPGFIVKNPRPKLRRNSLGKEDLLLIIGHKNFSYSIHNTEKELIENVRIQKKFLNSLNTELLKKSSVRFHPNSLINYENGLVKDIANFEVKSVNFGNSNVRPLIKRSRIVIHAYDSTGILETLSQNIPTMAFWHKDSSPKNQYAENYYQILEEVGIIHYNGDSAANFLNLNFEKIDEWWLSDKVQKAREIFCREYARTNYQPVRSLTRILKIS